MVKLFASYIVLLNILLLSTAEARDSFRYPVKNPYVTSEFQPARRHPTLGIIRPHKGVDFRAPTGTNIFASFDGKVEVAKWSQSFGNVVFIAHRIAGKLYRTVYAHLSAFAHGLKNGMRIVAGQLLGQSGSTGQASGPHLHFELHKGHKAVNPIPYLNGKKVGVLQKKREIRKTKRKKHSLGKLRFPGNKKLTKKQERKLRQRFKRLYMIVLQKKTRKGVLSRLLHRDVLEIKLIQKQLNSLKKQHPKVAKKMRRKVYSILRTRPNKKLTKKRSSWFRHFI